MGRRCRLSGWRMEEYCPKGLKDSAWGVTQGGNDRKENPPRSGGRLVVRQVMHLNNLDLKKNEKCSAPEGTYAIAKPISVYATLLIVHALHFSRKGVHFGLRNNAAVSAFSDQSVLIRQKTHWTAGKSAFQAVYSPDGTKV